MHELHKTNAQGAQRKCTKRLHKTNTQSSQSECIKLKHKVYKAPRLELSIGNR